MKQSEIVTIIKKDLFTTSKEVAEGTHVSHANIQKHLNKHQERFKRFGDLTLISNPSSKSNNPEVIYLLNEQQATFLITFLRNTDTVLDFKERLVKEFFRMKNVLNSITTMRNNAEWREKRQLGISTRKNATDKIKEFIEYARKQGSRSAEKYFIHYSKLENSCLFILGDIFKVKKDKPNVRDFLTIFQLNNIEVADRIVEKAIDDGIRDELYYKDVYKLAKKRLSFLSESLGQSPVPKMKSLTEE